MCVVETKQKSTNELLCLHKHVHDVNGFSLELSLSALANEYMTPACLGHSPDVSTRAPGVQAVSIKVDSNALGCS